MARGTLGARSKLASRRCETWARKTMRTSRCAMRSMMVTSSGRASSRRGQRWESPEDIATKTYFRQRFTFRAKRSEEHTSELQSHLNLVCRLLLEKKKKKKMHA